MARHSPEISVVIPVRNGARTIPALLESLARQSLETERFEVIVVDNGSTDATARIAAAAGARVVSEPVPNRSRARNRGAAAARAPRLAFTDADCVATPGWLEALLACSPDAPLLAGEVRLTTRPWPSALERFEALWRFGQESWVRQGWAATANLSASRSAFAEIGGFDPSFAYIGEDADFCFRAGRAGLRLEFCPEAIVTHDADRRLAEFLSRAFRHGYSAAQVYHRLGIGHRAWRDPLPLFSSRRALGFYGQRRGAMPAFEHARMAWFARASYGARILGSAWSELRRAR
jgi:GT2 family glycosyltransferase